MAYAPLELVVAVSENDVIGRGNQLPWRLPADLRHFKLLTMGRPILMGRKTYESIGKALPGRVNLVLSRSPGFAPSDCTVVSSLENARIAAGTKSPLMVIGGGEIYRLCMPLADRIHLTLVHTRVEDGDAFFSDWRAVRWQESSRDRFAADEKNPHPYSFITLDRDGGR
jgi:dihydrofolate reductase